MNAKSIFWCLFKSLVSCWHPHYLSKTSPLSIHLARNSRIWQIYCEEHICDFVAGSTTVFLKTRCVLNIFSKPRRFKKQSCDRREAESRKLCPPDSANFVDFSDDVLDRQYVLITFPPIRLCSPTIQLLQNLNFCKIFPPHPPKNGVIALWPYTRVVKYKYYVSQKQNGFYNKNDWYSMLLTFKFEFTAGL